MKRLLTLAALAAIALVSCNRADDDYASYVNVKIGSGGHGHVFVGASVPFGMVQLGPSSIPQSWDWCSGYHASDSTVIGFSHTHLSGTGCSDLEDITLMPVCTPAASGYCHEGGCSGHICPSQLTYARGTEDDPASGLWSYADRTTEVAEPGYYAVRLERYGVFAEMTATARVGISRYTFDEGSSDAAIVFDLENGIGDKATSADICIVDSCRIRGHRWSKGWANNQKIWFEAEFSQPFSSHEVCGTDGLYHRFGFDGAGTVMVKVALSNTSPEGATANMAAELPGWNFDATRAAARKAWNAELSKIRIKTDDASARSIFYTALYHTMISPALYTDAGEDPRYTVLSLWDTYRAQMPLFTIIHPEKTDDFASTLIELYQREGHIPVWHLMGCETWCMIGNPGICVLSDIITKGFDGFDRDAAWEALKTSALREDRGQGQRMKNGFICSEGPCNYPVAYEMEYSIADWALAQVAKQYGYTDDYEYFLNRSHNWRRYFDPATGFVRGIMPDGSFREPFNPFHSNHIADDYCEGNAWQYTWLAPHDREGLEACFGSREKMLAALDSLFAADSRIDGEHAAADITGLIGQYVHGNEPSHHIAYLYAASGKPERTVDLVRQICATMYLDNENGMCGNEDAGQMSAWYILSALGFYQIEPAGGHYWFGAPLFDEAVVALPGGKSLKIVNRLASGGYVGSVRLNGRTLATPYITYGDIMSGGTLEFLPE